MILLLLLYNMSLSILTLSFTESSLMLATSLFALCKIFPSCCRDYDIVIVFWFRSPLRRFGCDCSYHCHCRCNKQVKVRRTQFRLGHAVDEGVPMTFELGVSLSSSRWHLWQNGICRFPPVPELCRFRPSSNAQYLAMDRCLSASGIIILFVALEGSSGCWCYLWVAEQYQLISSGLFCGDR